MKKLKEFIYRDSAKTRERIFLVAAIVSGLLVAIGFKIKFLLILAIPLFLLTILYGRLAFRCPHCDTFLGTAMTLYAHCPHCGAKLDGSAPRSLR